MAHEEWFEKSEIYATGALDGEELKAFEAHLSAGCSICEAYLRETRETLMVLHRTLAPMTPSPSIKPRLLDEIASEKVAPLVRPRTGLRRWQVMVGTLAASIVAAVITGVFVQKHYEPRLTSYTAVIDLLRDPATRDLRLAGVGPTPQAKGRFLWNESGEGYVFATDLPAAPAGKMYAVWTIVAQASPRYVGTIRTDEKGEGTLHINSPRSEKPVETFAVTLEPEGSTDAPTGPMVLVSKPS
jgi:anti-sigma-K factor RskA